MKIARIFAVVCALALVLAAAGHAQQAAKVAGKWELTSEGRQGPMTRNMTIEQDGDKIKGVISGQRGDQEFTGMVKGNDISFTVKFQTPNGERTVEYKGTVDGESMKGTAAFGERQVEWTAKRAK